VIFVDTSAWYALFTARDVNHLAANQFIAPAEEPLITTDYVVDETLTLFRARGEQVHSMSFGKKVIDGSFAEILSIELIDFARAWDIFRQYNDKDWSFTDCTSLVIMQRLGIQRAFAFDDHFRQFGTVTVVP